MTDQPTPRDVIADWLDDSYGSREDFLGYADAIIDALAAAGYRIARSIPEWVKTALPDPWTVRSEQRRDRVVVDEKEDQ